MFTPEIRKIYFNHQPKYRERIKKQLRDNKFIMDVVFHNKKAFNIDTVSFMNQCNADFKEMIYRSGCTKPNSVNAINRFYNKYYHLKIDSDFVSYCVVPAKKGRTILLGLIRPVKTSRGTVYIVNSVHKDVFFLIHAHAIQRYGQRFNGTTNLTECIRMITKELSHVRLEGCGKNEPMDLLKKGLAASPINVIIGSGILLADEIVTKDYTIHYVKTYVPMSMLTDRQDDLHEELWNEIMEERKNQKLKIPFL